MRAACEGCRAAEATRFCVEEGEGTDDTEAEEGRVREGVEEARREACRWDKVNARPTSLGTAGVKAGGKEGTVRSESGPER